MSDAPELNPCPFCGQTPTEIVDATRHLGCYRIIHRRCVIPNFSLEGNTAAHVADQWNTRADLPPTLAQAMMVPEVREIINALKIIEQRGYILRGAGHTAQTTARAALYRIGETK